MQIEQHNIKKSDKTIVASSFEELESLIVCRSMVHVYTPNGFV